MKLSELQKKEPLLHPRDVWKEALTPLYARGDEKVIKDNDELVYCDGSVVMYKRISVGVYEGEWFMIYVDPKKNKAWVYCGISIEEDDLWRRVAVRTLDEDQ